jgi:glycosyltransferase involved in cell wall biosynthesis
MVIAIRRIYYPESIKEWDIAHGGDIDLSKTYHMNNGLDIEQFNRSIKENTLVDSDLDAELYNVVYVGSIRLMNNIGNLLDAAKILKNEKGIQFLIYGDGEHKGTLDQRIIDEKNHKCKNEGLC